MKVRSLQEGDLDQWQPMPALGTLDGWAGVRDDGTVCCAGGGTQQDWGYELWVLKREDLSRSEQLSLARTARAAVWKMIEDHGEVWTSTDEDQWRWVTWLGFRPWGRVKDIWRWRMQTEDLRWVP